MTVYTFNGKTIKKSNAGRTYRYSAVRLDGNGDVAEVLAMSTTESRCFSSIRECSDPWYARYVGEKCRTDEQYRKYVKSQIDYWNSFVVVEVEAHRDNL